MFAKLLVFVLAVHMATCATMIKQSDHMATSTPTSTSTTIPTTMTKPTVPSYPSQGVIEILNYPNIIHEGTFIEKRKILNMENSSKLQAKSITIEDSIIPVEGKTLYIIANHVKLFRNAFVGNNYAIRIIAEKIDLMSNLFVGDSSTYEALGGTISVHENYYVGDNLSYKVLGSSIIEVLNKFTGNDHHYNLTAVDIQQIRNEYSEDLPIYNRVGFGTGNPNNVTDKTRQYISRESCIFWGNRQIHEVNGSLLCDYDNHFSGENMVFREHGTRC
uniref:Early-expressed protein 1 n=1 Tax=Bracoviriform congregatae TaxID=39640 RepID=Q84175_9VIRU|nr:early-expressed protein 1 [Bracoviriform congregatae]